MSRLPLPIIQCPECKSRLVEFEGHVDNMRYQCGDCGLYWTDDDVADWDLREETE